jgi:hypothetical protein
MVELENALVFATAELLLWWKEQETTVVNT